MGNVADADFEAVFPELKGVIKTSDGFAYTSPAGTFLPNPFGLYDMHGNVWECWQDWYSDYPAGSVTDPQGPTDGSGRVIRGGAWDDYARHERSAYRISITPGNRYSSLGFRLTLPPGQ